MHKFIKLNTFKGMYLLILFLPQNTVIKTKSKAFKLKKGYYIYVGSAMVGIKRVLRHLKKEKRRHWHIDFLLDKSQIELIVLIPSRIKMEEKLSIFISTFGKLVIGFGASDIKTKSNLIRLKKKIIKKVLNELKKTFNNVIILKPEELITIANNN